MDAVAVVCDRKWTSIDVFAAILKAAKCVVQKKFDDPSIGASTVRFPPNDYETLDIDLGHTADFLIALSKSFLGTYIVIEEFHYLSEDEQRDLAFKLKAVHEHPTRYKFIIIGVWLENNRLVHLNRDLVGRVAPINADHWTDGDLLRVILEGADKLNIVFPTGFAEKVVKGACGSVYLVREACRRACEIAGIYKHSNERKLIEGSPNVTTILKDISSAGVDYQGQIISLLGLDDIELSEDERLAELKEWVLRTLVYAKADEMRKGITLDTLRSLISHKHPQHYHPSPGQIERIIKAVQSVQLAKGQSLFDYDRQDKIVRFVDKGFILWRSGTDEVRIEDLIFEGKMPVIAPPRKPRPMSAARRWRG